MLFSLWPVALRKVVNVETIARQGGGGGVSNRPP
jgi:hypothetical protein